jgi:glycosyltransferase involved in cell wall biosynthesis
LSALLSINNYFYRRGGAEVVFLEQNRLFEKQGWDVALFCMHHANNFQTPWSKYFVTEVEFGKSYPLRQKLVRVLKAVYSFEAREKLKQLLDEVRPDVAHCHNIYHHISPAILGILRRHDIPTIVTLHDLKLACPAYSMLAPDGICERCKNGALHNLLLQQCMKGSFSLSCVVMFESALHRLIGSYSKNVDIFIVPSRFYMEKFVAWGWDPKRFVHIPNFVDSVVLQPDFSPGKYFLFFGRLSQEKGVATLVKAAALAGVHLCIAGTGPQEAELRRLAGESGAKVSFLGYLSGEKLHEAMRAARATILPSEWYENGPISILESYACGKPVIGAAIGGIPEFIRERETGLTFESGSVEGLAEALMTLENMPVSKVSEMGRASRAWIEVEFTAERYMDRVLRVYSDLGVI